MNTQEVTGSLPHWVAKEVEMTILSEFSIEELEEEITRRKSMEANGYLNRVQEAVNDLEEYSRRNSLMVYFDFGVNGLPLSFDPHMNEWECD
jgi:hypothetical protein